ncbi:MAG: DUF58 domain-containing protein [Cardiobacteriaceae bacterium]|nr:DUF58 domain-containing protein [Cardiobacteriaceae bacterium]
MRIEERLRLRWQKRQRKPVSQRDLPSALRMPVVPTRFGWAFFAVLAVMFIWSANHQLNLGYALTFLAFSVFLLGGTITAGQLAGMSLQAQAGAPVWAGDEASFVVQIVEHEGRMRGVLHVRNEWNAVTNDDALAGATVQVVMREPTWQRGWHQMAPIEIYCTHPLGAFVTWTWSWLEARVLVYPRPVGEQPLPWQITEETGKVLGMKYGDDELSGLRPYILGEPLSRVAWKRQGRGEMMLKQFAGEGAPRLLLDFAVAHGGTEQRLSQLAKWIVEAEAQELSYALRLPNVYFDFSRGREHREACLRALALFGGGA